MNYFKERMQRAGINDTDNAISIQYEERYCTVPFFNEDKDGNIVINYYHLDGTPMQWEKGVNRKATDYRRVRFCPEIEAQKGHKYESEKETKTRFFYPKTIIEAYAKEEKIKTLYITEGEIKAFVASLNGMPTVGIAGIHNFEKTADGYLSQEFVQLCAFCEVENIVFLQDADCISNSKIQEYFEKGKDLQERLLYFFSAIKKFRDLVKNSSINSELYFARILGSYEKAAKGIDDLFAYANKETVLADSERLDKANKYFYFLNITNNNYTTTLQKYFLLTLDKHRRPALFYEQYADLLDDKDFIFGGTTYQIKDNHAGKPELVAIYHPMSDLFIRVGTSYFLKGFHLSKDTKNNIIKSPCLTEWDKGTIKDDYGHINGFIQSIKKYQAFCNIPENDPQLYQSEIQGCYNLYHPIKWEAKQGDWSNTEQMLRHVFGSQYSYGLDWITLLFNNPTQKLPAICLVSKEEGTGKSTLFEWLAMILGENATKIGNEDFKENFNSHWISKLLVAIEETFIEKKETKERLKALITNPKAHIRAMRENKSEIDNNLHLIMNSNNEEDFIKMDSEKERRFWVIKLNVIPKETYDPSFDEKLEKEIPAFISFIKKRAVEYKKKTSLWFDMDDLFTEAMRNVVSASRTVIEKAMIEYFNEVFTIAELDGKVLEEIQFTPTCLGKMLNKKGVRSYSIESEISRAIKKWKLTPPPSGESPKWIRFPYVDETTHTVDPFEHDMKEDPREHNEITQVLRWQSFSGRPYTITKQILQQFI